MEFVLTKVARRPAPAHASYVRFLPLRYLDLLQRLLHLLLHHRVVACCGALFWQCCMPFPRLVCCSPGPSAPHSTRRGPVCLSPSTLWVCRDSVTLQVAAASDPGKVAGAVAGKVCLWECMMGGWRA